jgi:hypothetical protein
MDMNLFTLLGVGLHGHQPPDPFTIGKGKKSPYPADQSNARDLCDFLVALVRDYYLNSEPDPNRMFTPMVRAYCENGDIVPMLHGDSFDEDGKDAWAALCRRMFAEWRVRFYGMVTEAWMAEIDADDTMVNGRLRRDALPPSQRANRKEVVLVNTADKRGRVYFRMLEIVRGGDTAQITDLKDVTPFQEDDVRHSFRGRFVNFLVPEEPMYADRPHPCDTDEVKDQFSKTMQMLTTVQYFDDLHFGDDTKAIKDQAGALASEFGLAWDRMRNTSAAAFKQDKSSIEQYNRLGEKLQQFVLGMSKHFSPETREKIRKMHEDAAAWKEPS